MSETDDRPLQFFAFRMNRQSEVFVIAAPTLLLAMEHMVKYHTPHHIEVTHMLDGNDPTLNELMERKER